MFKYLDCLSEGVITDASMDLICRRRAVDNPTKSISLRYEQFRALVRVEKRSMSISEVSKKLQYS
jgi:hypothetical protein